MIIKKDFFNGIVYYLLIFLPTMSYKKKENLSIFSIYIAINL